MGLKNQSYHNWGRSVMNLLSLENCPLTAIAPSPSRFTILNSSFQNRWQSLPERESQCIVGEASRNGNRMTDRNIIRLSIDQ
jgi:hypothetical protein